MVNPLTLIYNNKFGNPALPAPGSFNGQTILITGASGGIGLAAAVHFVNLGASSVIITTRSEAKCETARAAIEAQTHTEGKGIVKTMILDMSTFASTKSFADKVKEEVKTIGYVLLNAGILNTEFKMGSEGFEETIQVNVLSTALLALLLLPWIKQVGKGKAHLGFVTSGRHRDVDIGADFPQKDILRFFSKKENFPKSDMMYAISKLLEQYVVREITKMSIGADGIPQVIVNPMCPGLVKSDLGRQYKTGFLMSLAVDGFMNLIAKPTEGGARTLVLATLTTPAENGKYITYYQSDEEYKIAAAKSVFGEEGQKMEAEVWKEVLAVLREKVPELKEVTQA